MKNVILSTFLLFTIVSYAQITLIPDANFEQALIDFGIDSDGTINGQVATADIENVTELDFEMSWGILDFTGLEDFAALEYLRSTYGGLEEINLSQNLQLRYLDLTYNGLNNLDLTNNTQLEVLKCGNILTDVGPWNSITNLDLSNNTALREIRTSFMHKLETMTLGNHPNLTVIEASYNGIYSLDLSGAPNLERLILGQPGTKYTIPSNNLTELDLSGNTSLEVLYVYDIMTLENLNLASGANELLTIMLALETPNLFCIQVDNAVAANNGEPPYGSWNVTNQITYSENCLLGLEDQAHSEIILYPNPGEEELFIYTPNSNLLRALDIFDAHGRKLLSKTKDLDQIDVSLLPAGMFFVEVTTELGKQTHKFVKK